MAEGAEGGASSCDTYEITSLPMFNSFPVCVLGNTHCSSFGIGLAPFLDVNPLNPLSCTRNPPSLPCRHGFTYLLSFKFLHTTCSEHGTHNFANPSSPVPPGVFETKLPSNSSHSLNTVFLP